VNYKSWFCLGAVAVSAAILTGCSSSDGNKTPSASPSPSASPATNAAPATTTAAPATTTTPAAAPAAGFGGQPVVADKTTAARAIETAAGLIPPTNGDNWAKTVSKGRPDPFATLVVQPVEKVDLNAIAEARIEKLKNNLNGRKSGNTDTTAPSTSPLDTPTATKPGKTTKIASAPIAPIKPATIPVAKTDKNTKSTKVAKANPSDKVTVGKEPIAGKSSLDKPTAKKTTNDKTVALKPVAAPLSGGTGTTAIPAAPKPKPEPTLARGIEVSGVIQAGGNTQVVVKLPSETFSRYVEVGERVIDGKVLVKRIENSSSLVPVVVLEEVGVEVARRVGDSPAPAAAKETK
jgi:hypothetical protein